MKKTHHYADCVLCLSGRICEDSDAAPPKHSIPTQSQRCWFFHRWSAYDLPSLVTIANEGVLTQRRVCTRCHAVDHRYVQAHN